MMLAEADEMIMDDAFLVNVVHPCFQNGSFGSALPALLRILRHRAHEVVVEKNRWYDVTVFKWLASEQDLAAIIAIADLCIDVIHRYKKALLEAREASTEHQLLILKAVGKACEVGPNATSVHSRLLRLLPGVALSQEALDKLVDIIWDFDWKFRLDIEDTRRLLTFLPHARERLGSERFLLITSSALKHSARLPPDDFGRVHSYVRGALDVVVVYFSSSGIEEVALCNGTLQCATVYVATRT
ncbi:hypothetical protein IEO21_10638 [Rhodonia placenta]|uniref:Uncharacterized protein n=1 Tax=Rhodonia placenta TaxID=104341 RepID=A0A8H7NS11_9APHY|nr:hypothetical protein IEO21_10638 [Postia placenta]